MTLVFHPERFSHASSGSYHSNMPINTNHIALYVRKQHELVCERMADKFAVA